MQRLRTAGSTTGIWILKRENLDLKEKNFAPETMQGFIRDSIANINGIDYVISIDPDLIADLERLSKTDSNTRTCDRAV